MFKNIKCGIFAAGKGKRFKKTFPNIPKPLIKVGKKALIDYAIENLLSLDPEELAVLLNSETGEIVYNYLKNRYSINAIMLDSKTSFESFYTLSNYLKEKSKTIVLSTTDTILKKLDIQKLVLNHINSDAYLTLGITLLINDEKPLLVEIDRQKEKIKSIGINGNYATNGIYVLSYDAISDIKPIKYSKLREFLSSIDFNSKNVSYHIVEESFDVDDISDLKILENSKFFL
jgi:choline kinase